MWKGWMWMWVSKTRSIYIAKDAKNARIAKIPEASVPFNFGDFGNFGNFGNSHVQIDPDTLDLRVVLECVGAHLAAEAALLVAAEGRGCVADVIGVHPDRAGLRPSCD